MVHQRSRFSFAAVINNSRGSAIMFSMFLMSLMVFIAMEVSKDTIVEYQGSLNSIRRVQAYYAAKACTDLSLLRIKAYQQARSLASSLPDPSMLDMIWQFPLSWPIAPMGNMNEADKDDIKKASKVSLFKNQFSSKITGESSRIDINDLGSNSESIRARTRQQLLNMFQAKLRDGSPWSKKYANFRFNDLISYIEDWIDADSTSAIGGDEGSYYSDMRSPFIPPNMPFKTVEEMHMVKNMEDEIFDYLAPLITIYGIKGVNINYADKDLLTALDARITPEVADKIIQRRSDISLGGRFKDEKDFDSFIQGYGISVQDFNKDKVTLYYDQEINFYISCIGSVGRITREIDSVVFDFKKVQSRFADSLADDTANNNNGGNTDACADKQGDDKFECQCQDKSNIVEKQKCITDKKNAAAAQKKPDQSADSAPQPGPPYVIFQDVK